MTTRRFVVLCATVVSFLNMRGGAARHDPPGLEVSNAVHYDLSRRLGEILPLPPGGGPARAHPLGELPEVPGTRDNADPVIQQSVGPLAPGGLSDFDGLGVPISSVDAAPPDVNGAVGANHYVQWVNTSFAVFDKATHARVYGPAAGNTLWSGFGGPCEARDDGDPIVLYDHFAGRWVFSQFAIPSGGPYYQCIAVSQTSDPLGAYNRYAFTYQNLNDYPKFGVWPEAYYATYNMFQSTLFGWSFVGTKACAFDRPKMLAGLAATQQCFDTGASYGGLLPSDVDGASPPPANAPNYLVNFGSSSLNLWKFHADFSDSSQTMFSASPTAIPVAAFSTACNGGGICIPQNGTTQKLDSLGDRLMYRLAYRNFGDHESLVVNHSVTAGTVVGVRWYELRDLGGLPTVFQQGTFAPDSTYRWMGSMAMDQAGDIGLGYSASSSTIRPAVRFTGRAPSDPPGTMQTETSVVAGGGSQVNGLSRWGDYSSMSVDPVDDCTFWYTSEYLQSSGSFNWSTRIVLFKFAGCGTAPAPPVAPTGLLASAASAGQVNLTWSDNSGDEDGFTIERCTGSGCTDFAQVGSVLANTITYQDVSGLAASTTYAYRVRAYRGALYSPYTAPAEATTQAATISPPAAPSRLTATAASSQVINLAWTDNSSDEDGFGIERCTGAAARTLSQSRQ